MKSPFVFIFSVYVFCFAFSISAFSQQLILKNTKLIGGTGHEGMNDILYDVRDKSLVFTGYTWDSCGTGDLPPCPPVTGSRDLAIGKVDSAGQLLWIRQYGSTVADAGAKLFTTGAGYMVLGGAGKNDGDAANNSYDSDGWLLHLDFQGNVIWKKGYGSPNGSEAIWGGSKTSDGGYVFIGNSNGSGGDIPFQYVNSPFAFDGFVIKTDSLGNVEWSKTIGGTNEDCLINVFEIKGEYYITAWSASRDYECDDQSWHSGINTSWDYYLIKLDSTGNYLWNHSYGGSRGEMLLDAIFDERDSTFLMIGYTNSNDYMVQRQVTTGYNDVWLIKTDLSGNLKWARVYGDSTLGDGSFGATIRPINQHKGYVITYMVDPPPSTVPPGYFGKRDIKVALLDSMGIVQVDKVVGGNSFENDGVCIEADNQYVVGGATASVQFAEGSTSQDRGGSDWFISYLEYYPVNITERHQEKKMLLVYPNPARGSVTITIPNSSKGGMINIMDVDGKILFSQALPANKDLLVIATDRWAKGMYTVSWTINEDTITTKMIVN